MLDEQLKYTIGLSLLEGVGPVNTKKLIAYCGSAEAVFRERKGKLLRIPGIGEATSATITESVLERAEEEVEFIQKNKIETHFYLDESYPQRLKYCDDGPVLLFGLGKMNLNAEKMISIVGTRTPTAHGRESTEKLIEDLKENNICVVSGLAYGIDITAHKTCVKNNCSTIGVLAHGLDRIYPQLHRSVAQKMLGNGGLLTEFISATNPDRENFPKRNRIVAGMCEATVVIESGIKGGSIITAMLANDYNRDVFAFPGRCNDDRSLGCNRLIKTNRAALIESAADLIEMMGWQKKVKPGTKQQKLFYDLDQEEELVMNHLKEKGNTGLDQLALELEKPVSKIATLLLTLEFKGVVKCLPGKVFGIDD